MRIAPVRIAPVTFRRPPLQAESSHTTMVLFSCHSPRTSQRPPPRDGSTSAVLRRVRLCTADGVEFVATPHSTRGVPRIRPCRHTPPLPPSSSVVKRSASIDPSMCGGTYTLGMLLAPPPHTLRNDHPLSPTVPYMPQTHTHTHTGHTSRPSPSDTRPGSRHIHRGRCRGGSPYPARTPTMLHRPPRRAPAPVDWSTLGRGCREDRRSIRNEGASFSRT